MWKMEILKCTPKIWIYCLKCSANTIKLLKDFSLVKLLSIHILFTFPMWIQYHGVLPHHFNRIRLEFEKMLSCGCGVIICC